MAEPPEPQPPAPLHLPYAHNALRDALVAWAVVEVLVAGLVHLKWNIDLVGEVGGALVALLFMYAPIYMAQRRAEDIEWYGFRLQPLGLGLVTAGVAIAVIVPLFALGYMKFYDLACKSDLLSALPLKGMCERYGGLSSMHWPKLDGELLQFFPVQLIVVALPEELFFRGYLLGLLEVRFPPKRRVLGGGIGLALLISSLAFALVHLPRDGGDPRALLTFFPGLLFGWMKSSTKSLTASTITHASCNILVHMLDLAVRR